MVEFTGEGKMLNRRGFLKGSALFAAAAVGIAAGAAGIGDGAARGRARAPYVEKGGMEIPPSRFRMRGLKPQPTSYSV